MSGQADRPLFERDGSVILESEFATIALSVDRAANGPRLRVEDRRTGRVRYLDALELETLAWLPDEAIQVWLDPSKHRWRDSRTAAP